MEIIDSSAKITLQDYGSECSQKEAIISHSSKSVVNSKYR